MPFTHPDKVCCASNAQTAWPFATAYPTWKRLKRAWNGVGLHATTDDNKVDKFAGVRYHCLLTIGTATTKETMMKLPSIGALATLPTYMSTHNNGIAPSWPPRPSWNPPSWNPPSWTKPWCKPACNASEASCIAACEAGTAGVGTPVCMAACHAAGDHCRSRCR